jgi:hypothetical protein
MTDAPISAVARSHHGQMAEALAHIEHLVVEGLRHGHFDFSITGEIRPGGKRQLVVRAGKSHKFIVPEEELLG